MKVSACNGKIIVPFNLQVKHSRLNNINFIKRLCWGIISTTKAVVSIALF